MHEPSNQFIPALGVEWLTPFYDSVAWLSGETYFKRTLVEAADIHPGMDVLDLGCGTGTLALLVAHICPRARVSGMDIDPNILKIAQTKIEKAGLPVSLHEGSATEPPFEVKSFDRVLTTLMLHHLKPKQKQAALRAAHSLLRPGGELHVADWGKPHNRLMEIAAMTVRLLDGTDTTGVNLRGELPGMVRAAGFDEVIEGDRWMTPFGTLAFIRARKQ